MGQGLAEYAIAAAVIAAVAIIALVLFGAQTSQILSTTSGAV